MKEDPALLNCMSREQHLFGSFVAFERSLRNPDFDCKNESCSSGGEA